MRTEEVGGGVKDYFFLSGVKSMSLGDQAGS